MEIPEEWRGQVTDRQTIRKRRSKLTRKQRSREIRDWSRGNPRERCFARAPRVEEWT